MQCNFFHTPFGIILYPGATKDAYYVANREQLLSDYIRFYTSFIANA